MPNHQGPKTFHEEQLAIVNASIAALRVDGRFSEELCNKFNELANNIFETICYQFEYGEPEQYHKGTASMTMILELINEVLDNANKKK